MKYSRWVNTVRWLFGAFNIIFLLLGFLSVGTGIWGVHAALTQDTDVLYDSNLIVGATLLIVGGAITVVISAMGFLGAAGMWKYLLFLYGAVVVAVVLVEIVAGITAFVFASEARDELEDNMLEALRNYRVNESLEGHSESINNAVDYLQSYFECCGVNNYTEWLIYNPQAVRDNTNVPPAGCFCDVIEDYCNASVTFELFSETVTTNVWGRGCLTLLEDSLEGSSLINGVIGFAIALIETCLAVIAFSLAVKVISQQRNPPKGAAVE